MLFATVAVLLVANRVVQQSRSQPGHHERKVVVLAGAYAFHFDTLAEMVATSATVIRGTVMGTARGTVIDEGDVADTRRLLIIEVDKALAGAPVGGQVTVETSGWRQVDGEAETELRGEDQIPVSTGDSGIFFLYDFEHNGHYSFIDNQGVLLAESSDLLSDDATVQDSSRDDPLVQDLEARTMGDVEALIVQADSAVDNGTVSAQTYPGTSG
jgi:hypothetical protein